MLNDFKKIIEIGNRVVIKVDETKEEESVIQMPKALKDRESAAMESGIVTGIGKCAYYGYGDNEPWVEVGDRVVFIRHSGQILPALGVDYRVVIDVDVICKVE